MAHLQMLNPPDHPPLAPTYSQICIADLDSSTRLISFSGQPGVGLATDLSSPPSFQSQVREALNNLDKCLKVAGVSKRDIVSNRQYIVKPGEMKAEDEAVVLVAEAVAATDFFVSRSLRSRTWTAACAMETGLDAMALQRPSWSAKST